MPRSSRLADVLNLAGRLHASREELFEALQPEELSDVHLFVLTEIMAHIEELEARMGRFEQALLQGLSAWQPQLTLLQTIPGIDAMGAAMLLVEIGVEMESFGSAERLASWIGICPGNNESAGKRKSGKIRKGNAWVRRLLCEFAQAASRSRSALKDKFNALKIRKGHKKSIIALAHKMLRIIFSMLKNNQPYHDRSVDYEELSVKKNAPRWIKMLKKHGFLPSDSTAVGLSTVTV
ncbi:MAG: IS110 family transposase [Rhodoferax sp.]|nr:IS110 family transposase [Rhodoferax sp.]